MALSDEVKQRLNIVDVVSEYVQLEKLQSRTPEALCPFHDERTPSFKLNLETNTWRCYGACNDGGDIFTFVQRADGISFVEALDKLCDQAGIERRARSDDDGERKPTKSERESVYEINALAADYWHKQLQGDAGTDAREYLASRGIDIDTAQRWGIGYAPSGASSLLHFLKANMVSKSATARSGLLTKPENGAWRDMFSNRIMFALRDRNGDIIGFGGRAMDDNEAKYINTSETPYFQKSELVFGLDRAADAVATTGRAVIVEGYMDVITAHEHGFRNVVACMGTAVTRQQLAAIATALPQDAKPSRQIVMCLDNDSAGVNATINSLGVAMVQFSGANAANAAASPVDIKVARPVGSGDGAPKDPDEAIRQDPQAWWQSIEAPSEAHEYAFETYLHSGTVDEAISAALPFIGRVPPSTVAGRLRIEWMAQKVDMLYDDLLGLLVQKHREQAPVEVKASPNRRVTRRRNASQPTQIPDTSGNRFKPYEFELAAGMVQHKATNDCIASLQPAHFESAQLGEILDLRRRCESVDEIARVAEMDDSIRPLHAMLMQHVIETGVEVGGPDEDIKLMQVMSACALRVKQNHLQREKMQEMKDFKQYEVLADAERRDEMLQQANSNNRQILELSAAKNKTQNETATST